MGTGEAGRVECCRECGQTDAAKYCEPTRSEMLRESLCHSCHFWTEKLGWLDREDVARIAGCHYIIGPEESLTTLPRSIRGCAGQRARIRFNDGRDVVTTNLWVQGGIPAHFRERLPDNAVFIREEDPLVRIGGAL